jgi:hypothetical protein
MTCNLIYILKLYREFAAMHVQNQDLYKISHAVQWKSLEPRVPGRPNENCEDQVHPENLGNGNLV